MLYLAMHFVKKDFELAIVRSYPLPQEVVNITLLRESWTNITIDFEAVIQAFQDLRYIGELRQRWQAIKNKDNPMYPYKREVLCPICRNPLLGSASKGKSGKHFPAYHCGRKINGKRHNFRVKYDEFNETIENFVQNVKFDNVFAARFRQIALEELEKRENQLSTDTVSYGRQVEAKELEIQNLKETIKKLTSAETIKMFEDDIEKLRIEKAVLIDTQDRKQDEQVDTQVTINYTNYFMEHLEDLLIGGSNPHKNASLFGLLFDEKPTYQELVYGTPKLACLFRLNADYKKTRSLNVDISAESWNHIEDYITKWYPILNKDNFSLQNNKYL